MGLRRLILSLGFVSNTPAVLMRNQSPTEITAAAATQPQNSSTPPQATSPASAWRVTVTSTTLTSANQSVETGLCYSKHVMITTLRAMTGAVVTARSRMDISVLSLRGLLVHPSASIYQRHRLPISMPRGFLGPIRGFCISLSFLWD